MARMRGWRPSGDSHADYMRCRTFGHMWDDVPSEDNTGYGDPLWVRCMRCGTERHDGIGSGGALIYRRYVYPDDYKGAFTPTGEHAPSRENFREMLLTQRIREARNR